MKDRIEEVKPTNDIPHPITEWKPNSASSQLFSQPLPDEALRKEVENVIDQLMASVAILFVGDDKEKIASLKDWSQAKIDANFSNREKAIKLTLTLLQQKIEQERVRIQGELSEFVSMLKSAPEMHGDIQADIPKTYDFLKWWQALSGGKKEGE